MANTGTPTRAAPARTRAFAPYRVAAAALVAVGLDVAVDPTRTHVPLCPLHAMTGLWCPLCGSLRAVDELVRGHVGAALRDNALLAAVLPIVVVLWLAWVRGVPAWVCTVGRSTTVRITVVSALVGFAVLRNLPFASGLRP